MPDLNAADLATTATTVIPQQLEQEAWHRFVR